MPWMDRFISLNPLHMMTTMTPPVIIMIPTMATMTPPMAALIPPMAAMIPPMVMIFTMIMITMLTIMIPITIMPTLEWRAVMHTVLWSLRWLSLQRYFLQQLYFWRS